MSRVTTRPEPEQGQDADNRTARRPGTAAPQAAQSQQDEPKLTVAAVARRLGVAPATLRTWDRRYGLGPSDHTSGRHRRYGPEDVARLELMQRALLRGATPAEAARYARAATPPLPRGHGADTGTEPGGPAEPLLLSGVVEDAPGPFEEGTPTGGGKLKLSGAGPRARGLGRAALSLDARAMQQLLAESLASDGVVQTWNGVLRPVLRAVAERRQRTGLGVEVLQLLVECAETALRAVIANAPAPRNPRPVVLAPVPGESRELELVALAAALAAAEVGHQLFGSALPSEGLAAAVRRSAPAAVVLWAERSRYAAPRVLEDVPHTRQRSRVFAAGRGWNPAELPGHVEFLDSLDTAVARVAGLVLD
ncbi:MAG: MerR family transcriptional regulator [Saccharopolyspora rectivirgula]|jgi:transposase-like protein|uniref:MerR family transcriptional regulator n=1 Tax=Saccharopolyspora rectivirgula TaxID=28042 RepID=UPI0009DFB255|nr:MerR family transcriptional regulator [Saccharopolyspora rectivirgula]